MKQFQQLSAELLSVLESNGITEPTQIQRDIIPAIFESRDVLAQSETGSGKTLSFAIPLIEKINKTDGLVALVLVPTRELCVQVTGEFTKFAKWKHLGITPVYGGVSMNEQIRKLPKTNILVATPGRLIDLIGQRHAKLESIKYLVLDEADRMLDMGFIHDIERILKHIPSEYQSLLFSATISREIEKLSANYLYDPVHVKLDSGVRPEFLQQTYYKVHPDDKLALLIYLLQHDRELALVFCNRKHYAARIAKRLSANGVLARSLHGDLSQSQRERVTNDFRNGKFTVLVATDVAARGLHIEGITHVYNYEIPRDTETYTHRVGRTARAGKSGEAISLVASEDEKSFFKEILFLYQGRIQLKTYEHSDLPKLQTVPEGKGRRAEAAAVRAATLGEQMENARKHPGKHTPRHDSAAEPEQEKPAKRQSRGSRRPQHESPARAGKSPRHSEHHSEHLDEKRAANESRHQTGDRQVDPSKRSGNGSQRRGQYRGGQQRQGQGQKGKHDSRSKSSRGGRDQRASGDSSQSQQPANEPKLSWKEKWQKLLKRK